MTPRDTKQPIEIETKFRLSDRSGFEARLRVLGGSPGSTEFESNTLLDDPQGSVRAKGAALRLRDSGGEGLITFKGRATVDRGVKSRVELESGVDDLPALRAIFESLGFVPVFRYEKKRTTWRFPAPGAPLVVIDETPIGLFAEIEGDEDAVRDLAERLGVAPGEMLVKSYVALYLEERARRPELPPDMTF